MIAAPTTWLDAMHRARTRLMAQEALRLRVLQLQAQRTGRRVNGFTAAELEAQARRLEGGAR